MKKTTSKSNQTSLPRTIAHYASSIFIRQILGVLNAYLKPLLLTPQTYGLWNLLSTLLSYGPLTHLGSRSAMRYRIPVNEGKDDEAANQETIGTTYYGSMALTGVTVTCLVATALLLGQGMLLTIGLLVLAAVLVLEWYTGFRVAVLKGRSRFEYITRLNYLRAFTLSLLNLFLILLFGIYGLLGALVLTQFMVVIYLHRKAEPLQLGRFQLSLFIALIKEGFPIIAFSMSILFIRTLDRLIISAWLGLEQLGYYGIAIMAMNFIINIPEATREIIEPKLILDLQSRPAVECMQEYAKQPLLATAYGLPLLVGPTIVLIPGTIQLFLPGYAEGIAASQFLLGGTFFLALSFILRGVLIARGLMVPAIFLMVLAMLVNAGCSLLFLQLGWGITGVAIASSCSFCFLFFAIHMLVRVKITEMPAISLMSLFPSIFLIGIIATLQHYTLQTYSISALASGPIFCFVLMPLLILLYNRAGSQTAYWSSLTLRDLKRIGKR